MKKRLPTSVFLKFNAYYYVMAAGKKRKWIRLSSVKDGMPSMYAALAELHNKDVNSDSMPSVIEMWMAEVMPKHSHKTQLDEIRICKKLSHAFVEFRAHEVKAPDIIEAITPLKDKPRTYNFYRSMIRELMRFSIEKGFRTDNPVAHIKTMPTPPRDRYITDSELRRIKVAAMYGDDGLKTRSGEMLCALIDMAYLTGQRISDLLNMQWRQVNDNGIEFQTNKTGAKILVSWTPKLLNLKQRLSRLRSERNSFAEYVFINQEGRTYKYYGVASAWKRATKRAGIKNVTFHDIRAKALTDTDEKSGITSAQKMGGHTTQQQTKDYVRNKKPTKIQATR